METKIITISNNDFISFIEEIDIQNKENQNTIIDISDYKSLKIKDLNQFLPIIKKHKINKKSIVIVAQNIDFNKISDKITVVPTLQEAHDLIEMEEIERDLGF